MIASEKKSRIQASEVVSELSSAVECWKVYIRTDPETDHGGKRNCIEARRILRGPLSVDVKSMPSSHLGR